MQTLISANNLTEGGMVALKMLAGVVVAAVLLYLVLVLSRVLGTKIEEKKYENYCEKYRAEHGDEEGMLSKADFIETRAKGNAVIWRRQDQTNIAIESEPVPNNSVSEQTNDKIQVEENLTPQQDESQAPFEAENSPKLPNAAEDETNE